MASDSLTDVFLQETGSWNAINWKFVAKKTVREKNLADHIQQIKSRGWQNSQAPSPMSSPSFDDVSG